MIRIRKVIPQDQSIVIPGSRPIPGHRQYVATEDGQIFKVWGSSYKFGLPVMASKRKASKEKYEYMQVSILYDKVVGSEIWDVGPKPVFLHRLVCKAFHGEPTPERPWVNHKDGNKKNNRPENLEWTSISENIQHAHDTGLIKLKKGSEHHNYGKTHSSITKAVMSEKKTGENHPKFKGWYVFEGTKYPSAREAAAKTGHKISVIRKREAGWAFQPKSLPDGASELIMGKMRVIVAPCALLNNEPPQPPFRQINWSGIKNPTNDPTVYLNRVLEVVDKQIETKKDHPVFFKSPDCDTF